MPPTTRALHNALLSALPAKAQPGADIARKPLLFSVGTPLYCSFRAYVYTLTHPPGGRTAGEHKIQLIVPGQSRGQRANFDYSGGHTVLLLGYQPELGVFSIWDAGLYRDFPYSRNVQVGAETVFAAFAAGLATQERALRASPSGSASIRIRETVVVCQRSRLVEALALRQRLTLERLLADGNG